MQLYSMEGLVVLGASAAVLFLLQKFLEFRWRLQSVGYLPGYRHLLSQTSIIANMLPPMRFITPGRNRAFTDKHQAFAEAGWDILSNVSLLPSPRVRIQLADAAAIKEVGASRARFPKPIKVYNALSLFGRNIVASEGDEWKKYRKITAPAFSDRNNKLVWDETVKIMFDLFDNVWGTRESIVTDHAIEVTLPIALFVIGVAGFGRRISWQDDLIIPPGHQLTFKDALHEVSTGVFMKLLLPDWAMKTTARLRKTRLAFDELGQYMLEMIRARRDAEKKEERYDLFSSLLDANDDADLGEVKLTESELTGNVFIFLVAGHETTAHTLCFTFALLALYQEEQERLYQHIRSVIPDGRVPTYEEMPLFTQSLAVFNETLRMFPPVNGIPKYSAEDTTLTATNAQGEKLVVPIPQGTDITINTVGLHYNPRYWKDPEDFNPSRFLEDWPRDAFVPFSVGSRACIGRKFFETEGIAILTMLVSRYKIEVKEEPQFVNETFEERKARVLSSKPGLTLSPVRVPLVFRRRDAV